MKILVLNWQDHLNPQAGGAEGFTAAEIRPRIELWGRQERSSPADAAGPEGPEPVATRRGLMNRVMGGRRGEGGRAAKQSCFATRLCPCR